MKYILSNLNWQEFEKFGNDMMTKILQCRFTRGIPGADGGRDLLNFKHKYVVQCKHIEKFSNLKSKLKDEVEKIKKLRLEGKIDEYFVVTSCKLSFDQREEIFNLFELYMKSQERNILSLNEIEDFLDASENKDILRSNHKLWLSSTILLDLLRENINANYTNQLKIEIDETVKIFVETKAYKNAWNVLVDEGALLLSGNPGVGKSSISRMLISRLVLEDNDYEIISITSNDIDKIVSFLNIAPDKKQIVFMDDFLGKTYLNTDLNKLKPLESLIGMVKNNKNKKIILNSRITILSDVRPKSYSFSQKIDTSLKKIVVEVGELTLYDKALILYNHLYFNKVPFSYYERILEKKNYDKIIKHKNFNPRIIEYVTSKTQVKKIKHDDYLIDILNKLDNPEFIWEDEYLSYSDSDRAFCSVLLSLSENHVDKKIVEEAYNHYVLKNNLEDYDEVDTVIHRLKDSFLSIIKFQNDSNTYVGFSNPSIIDYLKNKLSHSSILVIRLFDSSVFLEQLDFFTRLKPELYLKLESKNFFDFFVLEKVNKGLIKSNSEKYQLEQVVNFVTSKNIFNPILRDNLESILLRNNSGEILLILAKNKEFYDYYFIDDLLNSPILDYIILSDMKRRLLSSGVIDSLDLLNNLVLFSSDATSTYVSTILNMHKNVLEKYIQEYLSDFAGDYINENISNLLSKLDYDVNFDEGYPALNHDFWDYSQSELDNFNSNLIHHIEEYVEENIVYPRLKLDFVGFNYSGQVLERPEVEEHLIEIEKQQHMEFERDYDGPEIDYHEIFTQPYDVE